MKPASVKVYAVLLIDKQTKGAVGRCYAGRPRIIDKSGGRHTQAVLDWADGPTPEVAHTRLVQKLVTRNCAEFFNNLPAVADE